MSGMLKQATSVVRSAAMRALAVVGAVVLLGTSACGSDPLEGVMLKVRVEDEQYRPDYVMLNWRPPGGAREEVRVPGAGALPAAGSELASILMALDGAAAGEREVVLRGMRGDAQVSSVRTVVSWNPGEMFDLIVTLGAVAAQ